MTSNYVRGRAREYRVKYKLLKMGALWVWRSYGSHGPFDLIAVFPHEVWLVQVKKEYISPKELERLLKLVQQIGAKNIKPKLYIRNRWVDLLGLIEARQIKGVQHGKKSGE